MNNFITKIEGHGSIDVNWKEGSVNLNILEGERLFEGILVGRTAEEMHWITPRICGVCPTAHALASLKALEAALGIVPTETTRLLRDLMQCGQIIQSHTLHLFFLSLPDYLGIDRGTELAQKNPEAFKDALALKEVSDIIVKIIAGRHTHPTSPTIGGFHRFPTKGRLKNIREKIKEAQISAECAKDLALSLDYPRLRVDYELAVQENDRIMTVNSLEPKKRRQSKVKNYKKDIEEEVRNYSTAKFGKYKDKEMFVGALARIALNQEGYSDNDKIDFANPFHNNPAQAIEIAVYLEKAKQIINKLIKGSLEKEIKQPKENADLFGIGATEAPRGGLYHEVRLDKKQIIKEANIVTPTVQNLTSIEKSTRALIEKSKGRSQEEIKKLIVMLVRAYDPCITCSVH